MDEAAIGNHSEKSAEGKTAQVFANWLTLPYAFPLCVPSFSESTKLSLRLREALLEPLGRACSCCLA